MCEVNVSRQHALGGVFFMRRAERRGQSASLFLALGPLHSALCGVKS